MKRNFPIIVSTVLLIMMLSGCGSPDSSSDSSLPSESGTIEQTDASDPTEASSDPAETQTTEAQAQDTTEQMIEETTTQAPTQATAETTEAAAPTEPSTSAQSAYASDSGSASASEIDRDTALAIAMEYVGVTEDEIYSTRTDRDRSNGIQVYEIEFNTEYCDYDFEIAISDGSIVEMSYDIDEYWLGRLDGSPVTMDEAIALIQDEVPGAAADDIRIWEERDDGWTRYEGNLYYDGVSYEFEIDPETGIIFDWSEERRS